MHTVIPVDTGPQLCRLLIGCVGTAEPFESGAAEVRVMEMARLGLAEPIARDSKGNNRLRESSGDTVWLTLTSRTPRF